MSVKGALGAAWLATLQSGAFAAVQGEKSSPSTKGTLADVLQTVGKATETVTLPDGTTVLLLPYGGRVLGVFPPHSDENFYWTNAALGSVDAARALYDGDKWQNSGGDRTWLSPEVDLFFPNFPDMKTYRPPRELDPGNYRVEKDSGTLRLSNRFTATLFKSKQKVELEIAKSFAPAPNPLRYERTLNLEGVEYAGYTQRTSLELLGDSEKTSARVGLWNLVQMPHGGDLMVPTYFKTTPKLYFGKIAPEDLIVEDRMVRYRMRAEGEHKIGIRATATAGRVGYLHPSGDRWALIVRNFAVNPSGEYIDVPWNDTEDLGYSTQACNVNSALGQFSELEYHIPAIGAGTGRTRCDDAAQVWAFRGPQESIHAVAQSLLTAKV